MVHTNAFLLADSSEDPFCSGGGAVENAPTEMVVGDLAAVDRCVSFKAGIPKPVREELWALNSGLSPDVVNTDKIGPGQGFLKSYLQTTKHYTWAMTPTIGLTFVAGGSKAFRYYDVWAAAQHELYGCLVKKYTIEAVRGKPIYQSVDFMVTQSLTPVVSTVTIPAFSTAAPQIANSGLVITIDTEVVATSAFKSLKYTIENEWSEDEAFDLASSYQRQPTLLGRNIEIEVEYLKNADTWDADERNSTAQLVSGSLAFGALMTITFANFNVWETNQGEYEERGVHTHRAVFKRGVGATHTI